MQLYAKKLEEEASNQHSRIMSMMAHIDGLKAQLQCEEAKVPSTHAPDVKFKSQMWS
jgi:hypothetical protein